MPLNESIFEWDKLVSPPNKGDNPMIVKDIIKLDKPITYLAIYFKGSGDPGETHEIIGVEWGNDPKSWGGQSGECPEPDITE